jgi:hypothetical protein
VLPEKAGIMPAVSTVAMTVDRTDDIPVLFDKARAGAEIGGDLLNEASVQHVRNSD